MYKWLKDRWRALRRTEAKTSAEVERIGALQRAAIQRRAEHAAAVECAPETDSGADAVALSQRRVQEAEVAYAVALRAWDDKQFRR